jgi:UDP-hydrolysing UDP-N-acetyl-D-glucosamine 2-epimerase
MHLDADRGSTIDEVTRGFNIDEVVPWDFGDGSPAAATRACGVAIRHFVDAFERLRPDIVLVAGDRIETFAAASAASLSGRFVAHVHGGDRAAGQSDDSLRHAITKLSHLHLAATRDSARRIVRLGEERWRVHVVGAPGIEGIVEEAASRRNLKLAGIDLPRRRFVLLVLHPTDEDIGRERARARLLFSGVRDAFTGPVVIVFPNSDPGARGIADTWEQLVVMPNVVVFRHLPRPLFLGLMRDAAALVGNSSAGVIESASFGTPVLDLGERQRGRLADRNVTHRPFSRQAVASWLRRIVNSPKTRKFRGRRVYDGRGVSRRIAELLAGVRVDADVRRKLISY